MAELDRSVLAVLATVVAYAMTRRLHARNPSPWLAPVLLAPAALLLLVHLAGVPTATYRAAAQPLVSLLGPATAALAIPLYRHRTTLRAHALPAAIGIVLGASTTMIVAVLLAIGFGLPEVVVHSIGIKSITAPVAAELAPLLGGDPSLAVASAVMTGTLGAVFGPALMSRIGITHPVARGLALGTVSHGIGTAQAITEGEVQGAASSVAMAIAAMVGSFAAPILVPWLARLAA